MGPNHPLTWRPDLDRWEVHYSITHPASNVKEVIDWCWQTWGHPGTDPETNEKNKWNYQGGWIYFYDTKYVTMYQLRWS